MTVAELIEKLQAMPQGKVVMLQADWFGEAKDVHYHHDDERSLDCVVVSDDSA